MIIPLVSNESDDLHTVMSSCNIVGDPSREKSLWWEVWGGLLIGPSSVIISMVISFVPHKYRYILTQSYEAL